MNKVQKMRLGGSLLVILAILSFISFIREIFPFWILPQQLKQPIFQILPAASTFFIGLSRIAESISGPKKLEDTLSILVAQSREDRAKEKVIRKLLENGVIKEKDIIERTQTESLVTVFHYGKGIPEEISKYFEKGKHPVREVLEELRFHSVGFRNSYFYDAIRENALPKKLRNINILENYIRIKVEENWNKVKSKIMQENRDLYDRYFGRDKNNLRLSLLVAKVFPYNLKIDFITASSFNKEFLSHFLTYKESLKLDTDKRKLLEFIYNQSVEIFLEGVQPASREKILKNESYVKELLNISKITDYKYVSREEWSKILEKYIDPGSLESVVNIISNSVADICSVLDDFL